MKPKPPVHYVPLALSLIRKAGVYYVKRDTILNRLVFLAATVEMKSVRTGLLVSYVLRDRNLIASVNVLLVSPRFIHLRAGARVQNV